MTISTRQLGILLVLLCAITLTLAWVIERRQILSFRAELDSWGMGGFGGDPASYYAEPPAVPDPYNPEPVPPAEPQTAQPLASDEEE